MVRLSALGALLVSACQTAGDLPPGKCSPYRQMLAAEDPVSKAERLFGEKSPQFLAVQGYVIQYPGVTDPSLVSRLGYKVIDGTSDAVEDESCRIFQKEAREYATVFNRKLIELIGAR